MLLRRTFKLGLGLGTLALFSFGAWKTWTVARELTDPPFYRVQPLSRVETTYAELAQGGPGDPGGRWSAEEVEGLQLWRLTRPQSAEGVVLLLHGFGDDRWGTSPALRWFPTLDAAIFTYRRRDDALRAGKRQPFVTFGAEEGREVARVVRHLEVHGTPRSRILLMGRSLGASVGLLALAQLEADGRGPLGGFIWEGAPGGSRDFGERLIRGPQDRFWHPLVAPFVGDLGSRWAAHRAGYTREATEPLRALAGRRLHTPTLCFLATEDRLAPAPVQRAILSHFEAPKTIEVPTWHLNCSNVLGPRYAEAITAATREWLSPRR